MHSLLAQSNFSYQLAEWPWRLAMNLHSCRVKLAASLQICRARLLQPQIAILVCSKFAADLHCKSAPDSTQVCSKFDFDLILPCHSKFDASNLKRTWGKFAVTNSATSFALQACCKFAKPA
ncbi:hypothetical protein AVEN_216660-1 [Araneus ventricosus]|uniref:Uncharacterized protein n=1 Tax=Araneus ventricosus TaxID=182803 RepID=A0A4Y2DU19_ARAVE|nr:hypothetical protein AVEN_216660-1 [Araneus ventricosus]